MTSVNDLYSELQSLDAAVNNAQVAANSARESLLYLTCDSDNPSDALCIKVIRKARASERSLQAASIRYERALRRAALHPEFCQYELSEYLVHNRMTVDQYHTLLDPAR